ncbi:NAD-dependent epimerase/dehydratase family protein [Nocardioides mangrovicus]|uniref:NAD-dependent epimerase/dehydratase family protein n=1 Tax=Nocardioides mangrovicus TaxID=2478913 RepID=A0A3L8P227_9ACTN|nr:NAD-dependent epimerase/dehydratase family protein [Nocardioides mangrovicus]RLV48992.1 NAD-dependent epimerase/dehydratase family protein [Nocardioides mangrovicus]
MTQTYVVTGAGPVGWTVTEQLADAGHRVRVLTRSGSGPEREGVERLAVDAGDPAALSDAVTGAAALFHCIHGTAYAARTWREELPKADRVVMDAAGAAGAVAVFPESLYSYTDSTRPMTEDNPRNRPGGKSAVRAELLHGRAEHPTPTVSVVASDFVGPRVATSHMGERIVPPVLAGKKVRVLGSLDQPHSWTYVPDLARAMITAARREELWNSVLHAPTAAPRTQREMVHAFADAAGVQIPEPGLIPSWVMRGIGLVHPGTREVAEMLYQFENPFVLDSTHSQELLGFAPTPTEQVAAETVAWWRAEASRRR